MKGFGGLEMRFKAKITTSHPFIYYINIPKFLANFVCVEQDNEKVQQSPGKGA